MSDLGLHYFSITHKKNASLIWVNTFVVYVTHISCIVSSSNWIMIGYRAVLNKCIGMAFTICGTEAVTITTDFAIARINVCFNVSFLDFY